ncbi:DUF2807 domain-containing protein [uncultured Flavobacterium sp.]|uniref:GIN domain-containing protein n=1 Tax=uncultured Flavobacterium sp. TaxID=165435 RepID=UPI0030ED182F|tara:strand:- start:104660 stop:105496 length:837 start_codon:yes stop_codon:yes gene_type:complete
MKKKLHIALFLLVGFSFYAQDKIKIKGNKEVITTTFDLANFETLEIYDDFEITFSSGNSTNNCTVTADSNLQETIVFETVGTVLKIHTDYKYTSKKKLEIVVNGKDINSVILHNKAEANQIGFIKTPNSFSITASDNSKFKLDVNAKNIDFRLNNNAKGDFVFQADSIKMVLSDEIDTKGLVKAKYCNLQMYNDAELDLEGSTTFMKAILVGKPILRAREFVNNKLIIEQSNSSDAYVNVQDKINIFLTDKAKLYLFNSPEVKIEGIRDNAHIIKKNK